MEFLNTLSVAQVMERAAALAPDKTAAVDGERRKTYRELNAMTDSLARSLSELGLKKGDRVTIYLQEWEGHDYLSSIQEMRHELPDLTSVFVVRDAQGEGVRRFDELIKGTASDGFSPTS